MKHALFLIAGAAALGFASPVLAGPGKGQGKPAHAMGHGSHYGHGMGGCPPGLAKKNNGCMPPGQAKKLYNTGQRFPLGYGHPWTYNQIPTDLRSRYALDANSRYYYGDGYLYRVDPGTMLISQVVDAILR